MDALLSESVRLEIRDDAGWTLLQLAVEAGSFHAVKSLIRAGADVNETEVSYGRTALHIAVENGHLEIVKYLLEKVRTLRTKCLLIFFMFLKVRRNSINL